METKKLLCTEAEAAKLLSVSAKTLSRLRKAGKLQFVRFGNAIRYELHALTCLIQASTAQA